MASQPKLSLNFQADRLCFLNNESRFSLVVHLTLTSDQPITLIRNNDNDPIGLKELLVSQCIECTDAETGHQTPFLESSPPSRPPNPTATCPPLMTLEPNRSNYITFTTSTTPRDYEYTLNPHTLAPDGTYKIHCSPSTLKWWTASSQETVRDYFLANHQLPPASTPPLPCAPPPHNTTLTFATRSALPPAPAVSISLSAPPTMSLSSTPKYAFTLTFTSHAPHPITVLASRATATAGNTDMEVLDASTRTRLAPDLIDIGNDDGPRRREDFLRLQPGVGYVEHRVFDPADRTYAGMEGLRVGGEYLLRMVEGEWGWWGVEDVETVMGFAGERGDGRLGAARPIGLVCGEEVRFRAVA